MFRFVMPSHTMSAKVREQHLKEQMDAFLHSDELAQIFDLLNTDRQHIGRDYNARARTGGRVLETQVIGPTKQLDSLREKLYPLMDELGFFRIDKPLAKRHSRVLVLAGAFNACFANTIAAAKLKDSTTLSVDGLSCYRPINPLEVACSTFTSSCETEFGVTSDAFVHAFGLSQHEFHDDFTGDRNLNRISCIREFVVQPTSCRYRVYAAPSTQPELRRANTQDTLRFYAQNASLSSGESLLAVTTNRYCNRQFLQLAHYIIKNNLPVDLDVVGRIPSQQVVTAENYDPLQFLQDLIGILDWIEKF